MARYFTIPYAFTKSDECPSVGVDRPILNWIESRTEGAITVVACGHFYEAYLEDAVRLARVEELVLTSKSAGDVGRIPLCGFPLHSLKRHTAQLLQAGIPLLVLS